MPLFFMLDFLHNAGSKFFLVDLQFLPFTVGTGCGYAVVNA